MKSEPKTMRFEEDVENYINNFDGKNFSEKFHNMVRYFMKEEDFYKDRLIILKKDILAKEEKLKSMNGMLKDVFWLDTALDNLKKDIEKSRNCFDAYILRNTNDSGSQDSSREKCITNYVR